MSRSAPNCRPQPGRRYLPLALGDGGRHPLHVCRFAATSSLLRPNPAGIEAFGGLAGPMQVERVVEVEFLELYEGLPLFADVDVFMRSQGFMLHTLHGFGLRPLQAGADRRQRDYRPAPSAVDRRDLCARLPALGNRAAAGGQLGRRSR